MNIKNLLLGILIFIIGLLLIIVPHECVKLIVIIVGCYAVINGITNLLGLRKKELSTTFKKTVIIKNLIVIVIGLLSVVCPFILVGTVKIIWKIVSYILAITLIAYGITGFISASMLSDDSDVLKSHISGESIICFLIAILMIVIPIDEVAITLFRIVGIIALICGVGITAFEIIKIIAAKKSKENIIEVEAEVIDTETSTPENDSE